MNMQLSDYVDVSIELKQGEPLSPLLFILFVNDIVASIDLNHFDEHDLNIILSI